MVKIKETETDTREEIINPALKAKGWGIVDGSKIHRELPITAGRIIGKGKRQSNVKADYALVYKNRIIGIVEAKVSSVNTTEGMAQAKKYAELLNVRYTYATNGKTLKQIDMHTAEEYDFDDLSHLPTPDELWEATYPENNPWRDEFCKIPFNDGGKGWQPRYYQQNAIHNALESISNGDKRILLTLATGTGKTAIAFQIVWKLFHSKWSLSNKNQRIPRVLFLADRNVLANQAYNSFGAFDEDALVRIDAKSLRKTGKAPTNGSIFFTIFQTFMTNGNDEADEEIIDDDNAKYTFEHYPENFFDLIIIDECHRGGAKDESPWREILNYFSPAVQIGLTATPKRDQNVDTYDYFGEPVYTYPLKQGIDDGFLTPFRMRKYTSNLDEYLYSPDDEVIQGEIEEFRKYAEQDFNRIIILPDREKERVRLFLSEMNLDEKTIVFCATQEHAGLVRDFINQEVKINDVNYCARVTANDGETGEQFLREFQDNEKTIPTILTTSQKLSTGVDARNIRNIVLMRPVNSMIEFKQIIGRGTRLYDDKDYFTVFDFVHAHEHFKDPEWDGDPELVIINEKPTYEQPKTEPEPMVLEDPNTTPEVEYTEEKQKIVVELSAGNKRNFQYMVETAFYDADGKVITAQEFIKNLYGELPELFENEADLRNLWGNPETREKLIISLAKKGFAQLDELIKMLGAEKSDLFDVLAYIAYNKDIVPRAERVQMSEQDVLENCNDEMKEFLEFVLSQYQEQGFTELASNKLSKLMELKYGAIANAQNKLGISATEIRNAFISMQQKMYQY